MQWRDPDWDRHCTELGVERVNEATGRDLWGELGGCPRSWREAAELYRRMGVTNLKDAVSKVLGPPAPAIQAHRGDVVMADGALGICRGDVCEFLDRTIRIERVECAWRVAGKPPHVL